MGKRPRDPALQIITDLDDLDAKITECNDALNSQGDDAMRRLFGTFKVDLGAQLPPNPFSPEYRAFQLGLYQRIARKAYSTANERTLFDLDQYRHRPFPYYLGSTMTAGHHLRAIGFMLRTLDLPPGARVLEFGPGWGNTTLALAMLGFRVTAVDIEPNFCQLLRERAADAHVDIDVVQADFFWAEGVSEPYDAVVFFECFHHCDDHMRRLRALRRAIKPDGKMVVASEPIVHDFPMPWGVRTDGESLWAIRNFGWLELGFHEHYFDAAIARSGWQAEKHYCSDPDWATVWVARQGVERDAPWPPVPAPAVVAPTAPTEPVAATADVRLAEELRSIYASTSWRATAPLRALRRLAS